MLIAEELLLLALDDETGRKLVGSDQLAPVLGGALVAELALRERVGITPLRMAGADAAGSPSPASSPLTTPIWT